MPSAPLMPELPDLQQPPGRPQPSVFLVGFMGSGKSSVGQLLARELGWPFVDLDQVIQQREGRTVSQIFHESGEGEFRRLENEELRRLLSEPGHPAVVALGGGAFVQPENFAILSEAGAISIFLDAPAEILWHRCDQDRAERPLRTSMEDFVAMHDRRRPAYLLATHRVDCRSRSALQIALDLAERLKGAQATGKDNER